MASPNVRLRHARVKKKHWTQHELAEKINSSTRAVSRWENGEVPSAHFCSMLCEVFEMDAEALGLFEDNAQLVASQERQTSPSPDATCSKSDESRGETCSNEPRAATSSQPSKKNTHVLPGIGGVVIGLAVIGFLLFTLIPRSPISVKPGGAWISPVRSNVSDEIHFAAYAYPTNKGDPEVDHVNFTLYYPGVDPRTWIIACEAHKPIRQDVFACDANLRKLGAPASQVIISFDVYDRRGDVNNAPNGKHTLIYSP